MVRKLLSWLGGLFVLALCASAVFALVVVKDRIRLVVQLDQTAAGPDPAALLRDDVAMLQRDLGELRTALGGNFERLGTALEERAETRHAAAQQEVQQLARAVASLQQGQDGLQAVSARLLAKADAIERDVAGVAATVARSAAAAAADAAAIPSPLAEPPKPAEPQPVAVPPVEAAPAPVPATATPGSQPAAKKGSFLSFSVPTAKFEFDQPHDYVLVPELCRVGFDAKSTLHDFTGVTSKVKGQFHADFDDPSGAWTGEVECEAKTLVTGVDGRDTSMQEHLDTAQHPQIRFAIGKFEPGAVDAAKQMADGTIVGTMTIRGQTRDVRMPVKISVDASRRVVVEGQMPLKISDYGVPVPSQLGGTITMQDEVSVWIALRARITTGATK